MWHYKHTHSDWETERKQFEKWAKIREVSSLKGKHRQMPVGEETIKVNSRQRNPKGTNTFVSLAKIIEGSYC